MELGSETLWPGSFWPLTPRSGQSHVSTTPRANGSWEMRRRCHRAQGPAGVGVSQTLSMRERGRPGVSAARGVKDGDAKAA